MQTKSGAILLIDEPWFYKPKPLDHLQTGYLPCRNTGKFPEQMGKKGWQKKGRTCTFTALLILKF